MEGFHLECFLDPLTSFRISNISISLTCFSSLSGIPFSLGMFLLLFKSALGEFISHLGVSISA